ncbi:MAG: DUF4249 domain-containing protein [Algoriphagus sp.]|nr:DUF4249 domain-containing protein [Algoriphagus sp.]
MQRFFGFLIVTIISTFSCVERIDFPLNKGVEKLIVSGQLTNLDEEQFVFLSETSSKDREPLLSGQYYVLNDLPRPVINANVFLVNDKNSRWFYKEVEAGKYQLSDFDQIEEGVKYHIEIEIQGKTYRSEPEMIPGFVGEDRLSYSFTRGEVAGQPETAFITIETQVTLPEQVGGYYFRWDVDEAYYWNLTFFPNPFNTPPPDCYVFGFPDPERISLLNGDQINRPGGTSTQIVAERMIDDSFLSRHYFNVRQTSINKPSYDYWRKVRELVNNTGSVFDSPPAPIRGNISNASDPDDIVLGYFELARVSQQRIYTTKADVPFFVSEVCTYEPGKQLEKYPTTCLRCSAFPNSTNDTPHWWFDD